MLHTIHSLRPVNTATVGQLQNCCLTALSQGATELSIHTSSQEGETAAGFIAYNFLKSLPVTARIHNTNDVESIANIVFLASSERFANPLSRFLLHPLLWGFTSPTANHARLREYEKRLGNDLDRFVETFNIDIGTHIRWASLIANSTTLDANKALEHDIINSMKVARLASNRANWWVVWWVNHDYSLRKTHLTVGFISACIT